MEIRKDYLTFGRPNFSEDEIDSVARVMRSGWIGMGAETIAFEQDLVEYIGAPHVVTVNSCTSALFLALLIHGVGAGDEVICPSMTWCASANAAVYLGATPVFCDIDPVTMCVTPESIKAKLSPNTKVVVLVHFGGLAIDVKAVRDILPPDVHIVEDAAHALGAKYPDGRSVGASGNLTCFSFYANKNLSTGDGGAIALFDDAQAGRLRSLRQSGLNSDAWKRFTHPQMTLVPGLSELGYKMNFIDLLAVIGRGQLARQNDFHELRKKIAARYVSRLACSHLQFEFQAGVLDDAHALHLLVVKLPLERIKFTRDEFVLALRARNIGASIHYAPLHMMSLYANERTCLPVTEEFGLHNLTLPISSSMSLQDVDYVCDHIEDILKK